MVICGRYMYEFSVSKDMEKKAIDFGRWEINEQEDGPPTLKSQILWNPCFTWRKVTIRKVATHLCLTLFVKILKINVEQGQVMTTLDITKH